MRRASRAVGVTFVLTVSIFSILAIIAPNVSAATKTWTTDSDFNDPNAVFTSTEVVGTGTDARVELIKDNVDWRNLNPATPPDAREGPGAAFSTYNNRTILFGGYSNMHVGELADTWEFDYATNTWTMYSPVPYPDGREFAAMSYDPGQKVVVLFGGLNSSAPDMYVGDTWEYNVVSRTWTETVPAGPLMTASAMCYDSTAKVHVMVGRNYTSTDFQTWAYNATANSWTLRTTGGPPSRTGHAVAYHEALKRTVLFGGFDPSVPPGTLLDDTWEYSYTGNSWSMVVATGPEARRSQSMTYNTVLSALVMFGGRGGSGVLQDTWRYSSSRSWVQFGVTTYPPARQLAALTYDINSDVVILFGGSDATFNLFGDTWSLEASYRFAGKYESSILDGTCGNVNWANLSWNKSIQPPNTFLRFQLATADSISGPWSYVGPGGSGSAYYTIPPSMIWSGHDNHRFMRFLGDFGTFDTHATPSLEDITIEYYCPSAPPYLVSTDPYHLQRDIPLLYPLKVTFSEPMNTVTVSWQFLRGPAVTLTPAWSSGNTILTLSHTQPFSENTLYEVKILGKDADGNDLVSNPVNPSIKNPWMFVTLTTYPYITLTTPAQADSNVALTADIIVDFSEPMNTSSIQWSINPTITLSPGWSNGDARLTLSHAGNFQQCVQTTMEITQATDKAGVPLVPDIRPNPWTFTIICINPFITEAAPGHLAMDVPVNAPIYVNFSKTMDTATVTWTVTPTTTFNPVWTDSNRRLKLTHASNFPGCMPYNIKIQGKDLAGNDLIPGPFPSSPPNPWAFMTLCSNPFIISILPANGTVGVPVNSNITIFFSEQMNPGTLQITYTPAVTEVQRVWDGENFAVTIVPLSLSQCMHYKVHVTAARSSGGFNLVPGPIPNPFYFDTVCEAPYLLTTDPANGEGLVPVTHSIAMTFSEAMNPSTVVFTLTPDVAGKSLAWSNGDKTLTVTHSADLLECTAYQAFVDGLGADGNNLVIPGPGAPDPWNFTTWCSGFYLVKTDPIDKSTNVPLDKSIMVNFSVAASRGSLVVTLNPPGVALTPGWSNGDLTVTLSHATPFTSCINYTVTVSATDTGGNPLITVPGSAPNPWKFKTVCVPPLSAPGGLQVSKSLPSEVTLTWRSVSGATSYVISSATSRFAAWPWPQLAEVATTTYTTSANHLTDGLSHFYIVRAKAGAQLSSNSTMGAKVTLNMPYDASKGNTHWFSLPFRSAYSKASDISTELTSSKISVVAKWNPATQRTILWYFLRGKWQGTDFPISAGDGLYVGVKTTLSWAVVGTDSSVMLTFNLNAPPRANINWRSTPYTSTYTKASDIVTHIEGGIGPSAHTKIDVIAKWDAATQTLLKFSWTVSGWSGTDFVLNPGDGIYLRIVASFTWTPRLITPEVP